MKKNNMKTDESKKKVIKIIVYKSNKAIYAQALDMENNVIISSASSIKISKKKPVESAQEVGMELAKKIGKLNAKYVFDRNGNLYHGQVKSLAEGLRKGGVNI